MRGKAPRAELDYRKTTDDTRVRVRRFYEGKRAVFRALKDAEVEHERTSGLTAVREAHRDAKDAALAVKPETPAGAAALLSVLAREREEDDLSIGNIIDGLQAMRSEV